MTPEQIRLECLTLAVECREARHSAADVVALAAAFEMYVREPAGGAKPETRKPGARKPDLHKAGGTKPDSHKAGGTKPAGPAPAAEG